MAHLPSCPTALVSVVPPIVTATVAPTPADVAVPVMVCAIVVSIALSVPSPNTESTTRFNAAFTTLLTVIVASVWLPATSLTRRPKTSGPSLRLASTSGVKSMLQAPSAPITAVAIGAPSPTNREMVWPSLCARCATGQDLTGCDIGCINQVVAQEGDTPARNHQPGLIRLM